VTDQPIFVAEYVERRSRLTTFFRLLLAIPQFVVAYVWGIAAALVVIAAWFVVVITGRYPTGMYNFVAGFLRYTTAVHGYVLLLTDEYPPFNSDTDHYPCRLILPPPQANYSRVKAFFRLILAIPVFIIMYAMVIVYELGAVIAWFAIVVLGRQPRGLQDMITLGLSYQQRAYPYVFLLTESWPSFIDRRGDELGRGEPGAPLPPGDPTPSGFLTPEAPRPER
jgi:hypothetical protein